MSVSNRHILEQGPALSALGRIALSALDQRVRGGKPSRKPAQVPGKKVEVTLPPRSADLVRDYILNVGGDPNAHKNALPVHFFPQWGFAVASRALEGLPYQMSKVLNVGCNLEVRAPIPANEPIVTSAQLVGIDDDGRRAVLTTRVITSTNSAPEALIAEMVTLIPLKRAKSDGSDKKEQPTVPVDASELVQFEVSADAGLDFAKLTGDFNPIHWFKPAARASGFPNVILHGFGTMARALEGLNRGVFAGDPTKLKKWSCRFTKPLVLPGRASLFVRGVEASPRASEQRKEVFVGVAAGGPAYLVGTFET